MNLKSQIPRVNQFNTISR